MNNEITLIAAKRVLTSDAVEDRGGGEAHGAITNVLDSVVSRVDSEKIISQFKEILEKVTPVIEHLHDPVGNFRLEEIKLGLAISADGSIGIATVGVESTLELCFKRTHEVLQK